MFASLAAAGLLLALTINTKTAYAYSIIDLPNMGFGVLSIGLANGCHQYKVGWHNDNKTDLGSDCAAAFQANLDAFMASHCPPYVCPEFTKTTTSIQTTTSVQTTTNTVTLPAPPAVTTTVAVVQSSSPDDDPAPADNDPAPYVPPSPPSASFSYESNGLAVNVTDTSGNQSATWNFGDGANGAGQTATHNYASAGSYVIIETVIDSHGLAARAVAAVNVTTTPRLVTKLLPLG